MALLWSDAVIERLFLVPRPGWVDVLEEEDERSLDCSISLYALIDPRTQEIRYAGQTAGTLDARLKQHIGDALRGTGQRGDYHPAKVAWIRSLLTQEHAPQIRLLGRADAGEANDIEREIIAALWLEGADLLNYAETPRAWCGGTDEETCTARNQHQVTVTLDHDTYIALRLYTAGADLNDLVQFLIGIWVTERHENRFPRDPNEPVDMSDIPF
jgi:hypothetical protein